MQQNITRENLLEKFDLLDAFQQSTVFTYIESLLGARKTRETVDKSALLELSVWTEEDVQNIERGQGRVMEATDLIESAQYVTNYHGQQTAVILPIDVWDRLLDTFQDDEGQTESVIIEEDDGIPSVAEVVARIKATPPNPAMIRQPQGTFVDNSRDDPDSEFDLEAWKREWAFAEGELRRVNCGNNHNRGQV